MLKRRYYKRENRKAIIDMDDFLMTYASAILGVGTPQLAERIYSAANGQLTGLDQLFRDHGFGRKQKFFNIGEGFINDLYQITGPRAHSMASVLARRAISFLGAHAKEFDHWKAA